MSLGCASSSLVLGTENEKRRKHNVFGAFLIVSRYSILDAAQREAVPLEIVVHVGNCSNKGQVPAFRRAVLCTAPVYSPVPAGARESVIVIKESGCMKFE